MVASLRPEDERRPARSRADRARAVERRWVRTTGPRLLVADPDESRQADVAAALESSGLHVTWCTDGADALILGGRGGPDALLVAARLPLVDPATVVSALRRYGDQPVLVGVGPEDANVVGPVLLAGATTVVGRPYSVEEVLNRLDHHLPDVDVRRRLVYGHLELDPQAYSVRLGGRELDDLPLKEFELLRLLMTHADHVVTPEQIREALWGTGPDAPSSNAVTVHVRRLRVRLGGADILRTVRGLGYRLTIPDASAEGRPT